jgi:hypothetical protein
MQQLMAKTLTILLAREELAKIESEEIEVSSRRLKNILLSTSSLCSDLDMFSCSTRRDPYCVVMFVLCSSIASIVRCTNGDALYRYTVHCYVPVVLSDPQTKRKPAKKDLCEKRSRKKSPLLNNVHHGFIRLIRVSQRHLVSPTTCQTKPRHDINHQSTANQSSPSSQITKLVLLFTHTRTEPMALNEEDDNDDGDEFFGDQDGDDDFGGLLGEREHLARQNELKTVGYVESYDETKETRLQEGFQMGYRETFDVALRIGQLLGQATFRARLEQTQSNSSEDDATSSSQTAAKQVRDFLTKSEQPRNKEEALRDAKTELEDLEKDLQRMLEK